jgi:hypothetical protein
MELSKAFLFLKRRYQQTLNLSKSAFQCRNLFKS